MNSHQQAVKFRLVPHSKSNSLILLFIIHALNNNFVFFNLLQTSAVSLNFLRRGLLLKFKNYMGPIN